MTDDEKKDYKKNKMKYYRYIIRVSDKINMNKLKKLFNGMDFCQKAGNAESRDKVQEYRFYTIPYDNSQSRDMVYWISILVCKEEKRQEIKTMLDDNFKVVFDNKGRCMSTHIETPTAIRGIWTSDSKREIKFPICIVSYKRSNKYSKRK